MRIGIDVDGVLADFNTTFIQHCIQVTERDLFPPRPFDIPTWNYPEHYGYTSEEVSAIWHSIKRDEHFWERLDPYPEIDAALDAIDDRVYNHKDDVYFITSRPGVQAKRQTEHWLMRHWYIPDRPTVLISSHKGLCARALELDKYIDDRDLNCLGVAVPCQTYLLTRPWNCNSFIPENSGIIRVSTLPEMFLE